MVVLIEFINAEALNIHIQRLGPVMEVYNTVSLKTQLRMDKVRVFRQKNGSGPYYCMRDGKPLAVVDPMFIKDLIVLADENQPEYNLG